MNVLVIGSGRLGRYLASLLDQEGHDVAVIDENADNFRQLDKDFSGITVEGIPMDMEVLKEAGIENCDAVAAATPDDNLNITGVPDCARIFRRDERGGPHQRPGARARVQEAGPQEHLQHEMGG